MAHGVGRRWCSPPAPAASAQHVALAGPGPDRRPAAAVLVCGPGRHRGAVRLHRRRRPLRAGGDPGQPAPQRLRGRSRALRRALAGRELDVVHAHGLRAGLVAALARPAAPARGDLAQRGARRRPARPGVPRWSSGSWPGPPGVTLGASADLVERAAALGATGRPARRRSPRPALPAPRRSRAAVRAELGVAPDAPLILSVGRLHPQKGYDVLVDAAARWRDADPGAGRGDRRQRPRLPGAGRRGSPSPGPGDPARPPHRRGRPARRRRPGRGHQRLGGPPAVRAGGAAGRRAAGRHRRRRHAGAGRRRRAC